MTIRRLVILAFRLFAIYIAFEFISNLSVFVTNLSLPPRFYSGELELSVVAAVSLFLIFLLWRKTAWLRATGTPIATGHPATWLNPKENPYIIIVSIIGIWEVFHNLNGALGSMALASLPIPIHNSFDMLFADLWIGLFIADVIGAFIGVWLFMLPWQLEKMSEKFNLNPSVQEIAN